mmetsp:Transcript_8095/g.25191  ORF Transcript_8095/g.25191 Transcript_8095/m.25191 type:complete len:1020 (-) Transcript_8095:144-3203(-)
MPVLPGRCHAESGGSSDECSSCLSSNEDRLPSCFRHVGSDVRVCVVPSNGSQPRRPRDAEGPAQERPGSCHSGSGGRPSCWDSQGCREASFVVPSLPSSVGSWLCRTRDAVVAMSFKGLDEAEAGGPSQGPGEAGVALSSWLLEFPDPRSEKLYRLLVARRLRPATIPGYALLLLYSAYALNGSLHSGHSQLVLVWSAAPSVVYNLFWLLSTLVAVLLLTEASLRRGGQRCKEGWELGVALFYALGVWPRCLLGDRVRVAALLGADSMELFGVSDPAEDELLLHIAALLVYLGMYTDMRFKILLLPAVSAALAYPVSTFLTAMEQESLLRQSANTVLLATVIALTFVGQRRMETTRRRALIARLEAEAEGRTLELHQARAHRRSEELLRYKRSLLKLFQGVETASMRRSSAFSKSSSLDFLEMEPYLRLKEALPEGVVTDWTAVNEAVRRIRDPAYTLKEYHEHMVAAFPELGLYTFRSGTGHGSCEGAEEMLSSGRSRGEELARTFGALHAVYWLMRLDMDGKQGFVFGYDDEWRLQPVLESPSPKGFMYKRFNSMSPDEKRVNFFHNFPWGECNKLFESAGLLLPSSHPGGGHRVGQDRLRAMLVLTAIHDVMKNEALCPTVQKGHGTFRDYREGQRVLDHDVALDYVLAFFGTLLPSYAGLDAQSQRLLRFTQGKMGFNNGWLVQGESPPGALFNCFKQLIGSEGADTADVAFYFVHWVTDLAGAEPTPLQGSEKFVLKFPCDVLASFFRSFPYVWELSQKHETEVLQDYLSSQWKANRLGTLPVGNEAIALMRLALHVQGSAEQVRASFEALSAQDREILANEMARSGLPGQHFSLGRPRRGAPALLVYYGPCFLQRNAERLTEAMAALAEVYRRGRALFPLRADPLCGSQPDAGAGGGGHLHTVTLRIEQIKGLGVAELGALQATSLSEVEMFLLVRKSDVEAVLERRPLSALNTFAEERIKYAYLNLASAATWPPSRAACRRASLLDTPGPPRRSARRLSAPAPACGGPRGVG